MIPRRLSLLYCIASHRISIMDGIRPAFSAITANDYAGYLWIISILGDIYVVFAALVRVLVKWRVAGVDDYLLGLATVRLSAA